MIHSLSQRKKFSSLAMKHPVAQFSAICPSVQFLQTLGRNCFFDQHNLTQPLVVSTFCLSRSSRWPPFRKRHVGMLPVFLTPGVFRVGRKEETVTVYPADVVLFEGILMFYSQEIQDFFQMKLFVDTDADTRLSRRGETPRRFQARQAPTETLTKYNKFVCLGKYTRPPPSC